MAEIEDDVIVPVFFGATAFFHTSYFQRPPEGSTDYRSAREVQR